MKSRSLNQGSKEGFKEEPHLSGAYIRTLVKQLTSSRTKNTMNSSSKPSNSVNGGLVSQNLTKVGEPQQPRQHKKQVRRRLHTSRPYQERLLNMAEARKEIVTALKFHRASMKQAKEEEVKQHQPMHQQRSACFERESKVKFRRNPRLYPSTSNYVDNYSYPSSTYPTLIPFSRLAPQNHPPSVYQPLNFTLPNQTLGLNLNFHDFNNIQTSSFYHNTTTNNNNNNNPFFYSSSSPSSSSSQIISLAMEPNQIVVAADVNQSWGGGGGGLGLLQNQNNQSMDIEGMGEIKPIGEQHQQQQVEWNDNMNLVSSTRWSNYLKNMEVGPEVKAEDDFCHHPFDEVIDFPSWLNTNENSLEEHWSQEYYHDSALPCMEIGEIEGMDGEWLA